MRYLWDIIAVGYVNKERVREVISITTIKDKIGGVNYLLRDEE